MLGKHSVPYEKCWLSHYKTLPWIHSVCRYLSIMIKINITSHFKFWFTKNKFLYGFETAICSMFVAHLIKILNGLELFFSSAILMHQNYPKKPQIVALSNRNLVRFKFGALKSIEQSKYYTITFQFRKLSYWIYNIFIENNWTIRTTFESWTFLSKHRFDSKIITILSVFNLELSQ